MLKSVWVTVFAAMVLAACAVAWAVTPTVSNVTASQRMDGSRTVDIYYDVADPDSPAVAVGVRISDDGGTTWNKVYAITTIGDIGTSVTPGTGKHIVWSAATDAPSSYGVNFKAAVVAGDTGGVYIGEMVTVPVGNFQMGNSGVGDDATEAPAHVEEQPQHWVYTCAYRIGKYEVTRGEYKQFIAAGGYTTQSYWSPAGWTWLQGQSPARTHPGWWDAQQTWGTTTFTQTDRHPVVGVNYYEAEAFANWCGCRLPTEAEWEKAARWTGGHPNVYPWGDTWDASKCNNPDDTQYVGNQTAPVGSYPAGASPYGCMDMAGNASEWCKDWFWSTYYGLTPPEGWLNPQGPTTGDRRISRGGSYGGTTYLTERCAHRFFNYPYENFPTIGFRIAR